MNPPCKTGYVECGRVLRVRGLKGDLIVSFNNSEPPLKESEEAFVLEGNIDYRPIKITALREQGRLFVLRVEGIDDREKAEKLRGKTLYVNKEKLPLLPKNEYYSYEILDLEVVKEDGKSLGTVKKIFTAGQNDVYEVRNEEGKEILIPAIDSIVLKIDLEEKKITVRLLEGMED